MLTAKEPECDEIPDAANNGNAVFLLQPVPINGHVFRFMFDSGCETFVCRKSAVDRLAEGCKENIIKGPLNIRGVGDTVVTSAHGHWSVKLPIHSRRRCVVFTCCKIPPSPFLSHAKHSKFDGL